MMKNKRIVSRAEWLEQRKRLLDQEKEFTRLGDRLSAERQKMPWVRVEEPYVFEGPNGRETLADLFRGRSQLVVYHIMFAPESQAACKNCSYWADNFNGIVAHLNQRDVTFTAISRAPLAKLRAFAERMGWSFDWVSSGQGRFNYDYGVSFSSDDLGTGSIQYNYGTFDAHGPDMPGISVFAKDGDSVFHTYSCYARGIEMMNTAYHYLDLVPKGRDETSNGPMSWVKLRDQYAVG
ncbi:DUF899 domain-containing protein [Pendulispora albinea]|uniref:DUF899 domain-containing protein n=1 Tax=Pendulispora albinea TaxID=2741071 RepID=A0ABZ2M1R4_9BACT